ncbi:MAG: UDP-N-acetylmuramoyl-tripeptide--D-alanyl-D-alanine ligase [Sphaerochaetaceae bacterium]
MKLGTRPYSIQEIASICQATVVRPTNSKITSISTDSRNMEQGSLFFALQGGLCDGSRYLAQAQTGGAICAVVSRTHLSEALQNCSLPLLVVDDSLLALQRLGAVYLRQFHDVHYVGITGSCGKSTTKEAVAAILEQMGRTVKTPGNLNSEIGLPLSVFQVSEQTRYGVFEMGVDHVGEMGRMLSVVQPEVGILTNIGLSHLEKFGTQKVIAHEKGQLFHQDIKAGFITSDCIFANQIQKENHIVLEKYSLSDIEAHDCGLNGWNLSLGKNRFHVNCVGKHLLLDIIGAVKACRFMGASDNQIAQALEGFVPMEGRATIIRGRVTIIEDCYNASLDSTRSILDYMGKLFWYGQKKVVLGPMKELGSASKKAHLEVARHILSSNIQTAFLYGAEMYDAYKLLQDSCYHGALSFTEDFDQLTRDVSNSVDKGDLFLVKGSHSASMERLIPVLRNAG